MTEAVAINLSPALLMSALHTKKKLSTVHVFKAELRR